jgi:hypothetical protein
LVPVVPPADIRGIVQKLVTFVGRNGRQFEVGGPQGLSSCATVLKLTMHFLFCQRSFLQPP